MLMKNKTVLKNYTIAQNKLYLNHFYYLMTGRLILGTVDQDQQGETYSTPTLQFR